MTITNKIQDFCYKFNIVTLILNTQLIFINHQMKSGRTNTFYLLISEITFECNIKNIKYQNYQNLVIIYYTTTECIIFLLKVIYQPRLYNIHDLIKIL